MYLVLVKSRQGSYTFKLELLVCRYVEWYDVLLLPAFRSAWSLGNHPSKLIIIVTKVGKFYRNCVATSAGEYSKLILIFLIFY